MKKIRIALLCLLVLGRSFVSGQDFSNKGKEFWIAYPSHVDGNSSVMGLYITASVNTTGTLQLGSAAPMSFDVHANEVTRIFLNSSGTGAITGTTPLYYASNTSVYLANISDGIQPSSAIKINTADPVVVYSHIIKSARSAATLALPTQVLGNEYIAPSMTSVSTQGATSNGTIGGVGEIAVVATQPNTTIEITPTAAGRGGRPAGTAFTIKLSNAGDCYQFQSMNLGDLSGTKIRSVSGSGSSCKPIAVFSATTWSNFDCANSSGGDNLYQQLFPTQSWGKTFVTAPFYNRTDDIFRIYVQNSSTVVQIQENGVTKTLTAGSYSATGKFYSYRTANPIIITGSDPISVAQYITSASCKTGCANNTNTPSCYGDPEMVLLNPVEQTLQDITFFSAHASYVPQGQTNVVQHYVNIIVSKNFKGTVKIDNAAPKGTFVDIPGSNFSYLQEDLTTSSATNPIHRVVADTNFAAIVYGYGNVESYGYNGGTNIKDFSAKPTFQNPYSRIDSAVTCVNTPVQFSVPLGFTPVSMKWDFSAAPNISPNTTVGPSSTSTPDSTKTISGQQVYYYSTGKTYTFNAPNTSTLRDTIKLYTTSATPDGCGSTDQVYTIPVKVNDLPLARFNATTTGCVSDSIKIADQSAAGSGSITKWKWDFGDGTTLDSDAGNIAKKYAKGGTYQIKLKVISDIGCISSETSQPVQFSDKPDAKFTSQATVCPDSDISFIDASTTTTGTLAKWTWNLDDGAGFVTNTTNASVKAKYAQWGTKLPSLVVETATGCRSDTFTLANFKVNPSPVVNFGIPEVCLSDANAPFTDSTTIPEGTIASYLWNFNAGSPAVSKGPVTATSTLKNPQVTYQKSDNYKVSLTATSAAGCSATLTQDFTVNGTIPKSSFTIANDAPYCGTKAVQLQNNSTVDFGNVTKLEIFWDYANNPTVKETIDVPVSGKIYPHSYADPASPKQYTIRMVAYSGGSACSNASSSTITLYPQPKAAFTVSKTALCDGDIVVFTDKSNGVSSAVSKWVWDLGKGSPSSSQNPVKQYNDSGIITTSLYIYNADGCVSDTPTQKLTIYPNPKVTLLHSTKVLSGGTLTLSPLYVYGSQLQYLWTPSTYLSSDTAIAPKSTPDDDITYKLTLTAYGGCTASDTIFVKVLKGPEVPNVFSPNGDGINDTWKIKYLDSYPDATVEVFNRAGQIVYRSVGYGVEWDGSYKGSPLPVGTYYYIINPRNGRPIVTGAVTIIK